MQGVWYNVALSQQDTWRGIYSCLFYSVLLLRIMHNMYIIKRTGEHNLRWNIYVYICIVSLYNGRFAHFACFTQLGIVSLSQWPHTFLLLLYSSIEEIANISLFILQYYHYHHHHHPLCKNPPYLMFRLFGFLIFIFVFFLFSLIFQKKWIGPNGYIWYDESYLVAEYKNEAKGVHYSDKVNSNKRKNIYGEKTA